MSCRHPNTLINGGTMTWFCCGPAWGPCGSAGGGACGTCKSRYRHCAWPNASDACRDITRPGVCGKQLPRRGCDRRLIVSNKCNWKCTTVRIKDCGPRTKDFCGQACCNGRCGQARIIDLTPAAFSAIASLSNGVRPVRVDSFHTHTTA
ncbi:MAG: septal ring lytic transglycosylase RlpA family protein [Micromonosporaceae bacterium]